MIISAIYFKDKDYCHLAIKDTYGSPEHLLVNGQVIKPGRSGYKGEDIVVEDKDLEIKCAHKKITTSHYMNRETEETMSVFTYRDSIKSFYKENGEYKDLESEYLCRKMEQTYIPVQKTYYEYEDVVVIFEEAELEPDKYCKCSGRIKKAYESKNPNHFIYSFNKWAFCNDTVIRLMEEYGIKRVVHKAESDSAEYYILHDKEKEYKWLEFCGNEYFINRDIFFGREDESNFFYGTYTEVLEAEKLIEQKLRDRIEKQLDSVRTVKVKKSAIADWSDKLKAVIKSIDNKKTNRYDIRCEVKSVVDDLYDLTRKK